MHKIYKVTNTVNGKIYIGKTYETIERRWIRHVSFAAKGKDIYFSNAIRKYGRDAFTIEQIAETETDEWSCYLERMWILLTGSANRTIGYNSTYGGEGFSTGDKNPNRINPPVGAANSNFGVTMSEEQKSKISKSLTGRFVGEKNPFYGKKHSPEMIESIRITKLFSSRSPCSRATATKIGDAQRGRQFTAEHKQKLSDAARKRHEAIREQKAIEAVFA